MNLFLSSADKNHINISCSSFFLFVDCVNELKMFTLIDQIAGLDKEMRQMKSQRLKMAKCRSIFHISISKSNNRNKHKWIAHKNERQAASFASSPNVCTWCLLNAIFMCSVCCIASSPLKSFIDLSVCCHSIYHSYRFNLSKSPEPHLWHKNHCKQMIVR